MVTDQPGITATVRDVPVPLRDLLAQWLPTQRWFPRAAVSSEGSASWSLAVAVDLAPGVVVWLLRATPETMVHVPLVTRRAPEEPAHLAGMSRIGPSPTPERGLLGTVATDDGPAIVYDGAHRSELWGALLATSEWITPAPHIDLERGRVLSGEQSNTSVMLPGADGGLIIKLLRTVAQSPHPDVDVPRRLVAAGFTRAPGVPAALEVTVDDGVYLGGWAATLAVVCDLVEDADDGFTLACALASDGTDIGASCDALGEVIAALHATLRTVFPVVPADLTHIPDEIAQRVETAAASSAAVRELLGPIDSFLARLRHDLEHRSHDVFRQRIHGDLHLGQTLRGPDGWWVLDFEGEPLRPPAERFRPDLPERDLAGLLRSIDYAAAISESPDPDWGQSARAGLITGYLRAVATAPQDSVGGRAARGAGGGRTTVELLVDAFELDKAVYEVLYEEQHRPTWTWIPLTALRRILDSFIEP